MPPFQPNIPQPTDQISASQNDILQNFQSIAVTFDQNHVDFNAGAGVAGRHTFVQLVPQVPVPAFAGTPGFWSSTAAGNPIMLHTAAGSDVNISERAFTANNSGWSYLPSGLLLKFGRAQTNGLGFLSLVFPGPAFTAVPFVTASAEQFQPGNNYRISIIRQPTAANIAVNTEDFAGNNVQAFFQWFAIGI